MHALRNHYIIYLQKPAQAGPTAKAVHHMLWAMIFCLMRKSCLGQQQHTIELMTYA